MTSVLREQLRKCLPQVKCLLVVFMLVSSLSGQTAGTKDTQVTAVEGESWIKHLRKSFNDTSMGRTWDLGPSPPQQRGRTAGFVSIGVKL